MSLFEFYEMPSPTPRPTKKHIDLGIKATLIETVEELDNVLTGVNPLSEVIVIQRRVDPETFHPRVAFVIPKLNEYYIADLVTIMNFKEAKENENGEKSIS